ncbi:hypothetical protein RRG08_042840 [Elysia crispata]|uniref:Uncharacterized protein n=1 Tax=Elysia crispata TaxID=231223 RepID=A0AAE1DYX5_9GAST|nr:hypothetical protein RRG08_042840 [Elysia crispata]
MAAGMTPVVIAVKEKLDLDDLEDQFHEKLKSFTSNVKIKMCSVSREAAVKVFESALLFLTQAFPDLGVLESASDIMQDGILKLREDFRKPERTLSQKLTEAQQSFSEELEEVQQSFSDKLSEVEERASPLEEKVENNLDKFNKAHQSNTHQIMGLRKLQKLLSGKTKITQTTSAPLTSLASVFAAATIRWPPQSLSLRSTFSVSDSQTPRITDMKRLLGGLAVLSDRNYLCVKLYIWQGHHICDQALDSSPTGITVMDITSHSSQDLLVGLLDETKIAHLVVTPSDINTKRCIKTSKRYLERVAIPNQMLAVGCQYLLGAGIDLIGLSGKILCQLSSTLGPW